jgi:hypothetical protein
MSANPLLLTSVVELAWPAVECVVQGGEAFIILDWCDGYWPQLVQWAKAIWGGQWTVEPKPKKAIHAA